MHFRPTGGSGVLAPRRKSCGRCGALSFITKPSVCFSPKTKPGKRFVWVACCSRSSRGKGKGHEPEFRAFFPHHLGALHLAGSAAALLGRDVGAAPTDARQPSGRGGTGIQSG